MKRVSRKYRIGLVPLLMLASASALAQTSLKIGYPTARSSHLGDGATAFCEAVEKGTQGRYKCSHGPSGAYGGEKEMVEGLKAGTLDAAHLTTGTLGAYAPEVSLFDIPFLFRDYGHAHKVLDGIIGQTMLTVVFPKAGLKALSWSENGFRHMTNNKRAISGPDDLKGLKLRTMENKTHMIAYKAFGLDTRPMPFPQLFEALQTGTVDGQENPISIITASKFAQVQKHLTLTGHVYSAAVLLVSPKLWANLSEADKKVFQAAGADLRKATRDRVQKDDREGVEALKAQGMQVVTQVDKAAFVDAMKTAQLDFESQFGKDRIVAVTSVK
jgi:tripartite ATP-independent transporter DctP family solute receptor